MNRKEIYDKIQKNRNEINRLLSADLPIDIISHNINILAQRNERLIDELKKCENEN